MQESHSIVPKITANDTRQAPLHDDIAQCARDIWIERGQPANRDLEIWLSAEKRLLAATAQEASHKNAGVSASKQQRSGKPERY